MSLPFISIVIPVYNEELFIEECLNSVISFDYPKNKFEVLIIDGDSKDKTVLLIQEYINKHDNIYLYTNHRKIVPVSMNMGINISRGDYIVRLDAHCYYPSNYITALITNAIAFNVDNIGTICLTEVKNITDISTSIRFVLSNRFGVGNSLFRTGVDKATIVDTVPFGCFTKNILEKVGGYDERLIRNQDIEINKRIAKVGGTILLLPEPGCIYFARENYTSFALNNFGNGMWNVLTSYYTNDLESLSLRHYIPLLFVLSIIIPLILTLIDINFLILSLIILCSYLISISLISIYRFKFSVITLYSIFAFVILHFSYGFGSLFGLFKIVLLKFHILAQIKTEPKNC